MDRRLELHALLKTILGSEQVYYQPPKSIQMNYPAIIYSRNDIKNNFADNSVYKQKYEYQIIVMDMNPDSKIVEKLSQLPCIRYDRHYTSDRLNHDVFILNY